MGGYLHYVHGWPTELAGTKQSMVWMDRGTIAASGFSGTTDVGDHLVVVHHERPAEFSLPRGKKATEAVHVQKFRLDSRARSDGDPFTAIRPTSTEPPDFVAIESNGASVGIECTTFADEARRSAFGYLSTLRKKLEAIGRSSFRHLRDCAVYVLFDRESTLGLPRPPQDNLAYNALIDAITSLVVHRAALWQEDSVPLRSPPSPSDIGIVTTPMGDQAYALPINDDYRASRFMSRMGFDLILGYTTTYRLAEVQQSVRDLIARKDKPGNEWLLITAGGPNAQGLTFAGEEFVAGMIFAHEFEFTPPSNIRRIVLHRWGSGDALELFPCDQRLLVPPASPDLPEGLTYTMPPLPADLFPSRNAPCPCGSGKTFKRCCGVPSPFTERSSGLFVPDN